MQEDLRRLQQVVDGKEEQIAGLTNNLDFWRQRFNTAEERAQREVRLRVLGPMANSELAVESWQARLNACMSPLAPHFHKQHQQFMLAVSRIFHLTLSRRLCLPIRLST